MDEREAKLPAWAQATIRDLRSRLASSREDTASEIARLRTENQTLSRKNSAIEELLTCAAKGGHKTSQEIISVLESYSLSLAKDE